MIFDPAFKWVWWLFKPWHLFPIVHLDGQGHSRITTASVGVYEFDNMVTCICHHVNKTVWTPLTGEMLQVHHVGRYLQT